MSPHPARRRSAPRLEPLESRDVPDATITEFPVPNNGGTASGITAGPDGALWFVDSANGTNSKIGRITPDGSISLFSVAINNSGLDGITVGPDGALWFTDPANSVIGRITTGGVVTNLFQ